MSLWTPHGEHQVPDDRDASPAPDDDDHGPIDPANLTEEQRERLEAMAEEMAEAQRRLASVPAAQVVGNHAIGLFELAAIHLQSRPPNLDQAQLAIDALAAIVEGLGSRLGQHEARLRDALAQIRMAFVQVKGHTDRPPTPD
ncbi:MAG: hypothetical protein ACRD0A_15570 [Acidimicrobiales bacterium]